MSSLLRTKFSLKKKYKAFASQPSQYKEGPSEPVEDDSPVEEVEPVQAKRKYTRRRQPLKKSDKEFVKPWTIEEEIALCKAWVSTSENNTEGNGKKASGIRPKVSQFCEIYNSVHDRHQSGSCENTVYQEAELEYRTIYNAPFALTDCWKILKDHPKWKKIEMPKFYKSKKSSSKKSRTSETTSQGNLDSAHIGLDLNDKATDSEDVDVQEVAPMGRDRAKKKASSSGARSKTSIAGDPSLFDALLSVLLLTLGPSAAFGGGGGGISTESLFSSSPPSPKKLDTDIFGKVGANGLVNTLTLKLIGVDTCYGQSQFTLLGLVYSRNDNSFWKELESTYDKREFHALTKLPKCVCEVKCSCDVSSELVLHQQLMKLMQFLLGMDDRYQPIRSALSTWDPLPEVKDAYTAVSEEESHRGIPVSFGVFESKLNASSFATKTFNNNRRPFNNNNSNTRGSSSNSTVNRGPNPNSNCKNYGRIGHTIDRCYVIVGFPPGFKRNANCGKQSFNANTDVKINDKQSSFSLSFGFTSDQMQKLLNLINDNTSGSIHASMAGRTSFFNGNVWFNNFRFYYANSKLYAQTITLGWIIDSGANQHLTVSTVGMFNVVDNTSLKITVSYPNGTLATISHVWNLKLSNYVILYDVRVVLGYCVSLLSVNKLIRDSKMYVGFDEDKCYIQDLKRLGHPSDQVLSVLHNDLNIYKSSFVPVCEASCAHTPQQNRIAETKHRHLLNVARSLMFQGGIPLKFWSDYVMIDIYLINRLPSSVLKGNCPYELVFKRKPSLSHLRCFGCLCFSTILNNHYKLSYKSEKCVLIGYSSVKKAYKLLSIDSRNVSYSRDVKFYETVFLFKTKSTICDSEDAVSESESEHLSFFDNQMSKSPYDEGRAKLVVDGSVPSSNHDTSDTASPLYQEENTTLVCQEECKTPDKKSSRPTKLPAKLNDYVVNSSLKYGIEKFIDAMNSEIEALNRKNTWTVYDLPAGKKSIGCRWIYKIKYKSTGDIDRYKSRLVAKGFSQREGLDYEETFSPVVKMVTVRCLISIVVNKNWPLYQLDVNNAFLYGDLYEDQDPRQWNAKLTTTLAKHGFKQSKFDYSLYVKQSGESFVALLVYVDDIVITGNNDKEIDEFKKFLSSKFLIKDLGKLKYFFGIEVLENDKGLCMTQRKYCLELLHKYGQLAANPVDIPLPENIVLSHIESIDDKYLKNFTSYQKLSHMEASLRVLRYFKWSLGLGIQFDKISDLKLRVFSDVDWAKYPKTRKSVTSMTSATCETIWLGNLFHSLGKKSSNGSNSKSLMFSLKGMLKIISQHVVKLNVGDQVCPLVKVVLRRESYQLSLDKSQSTRVKMEFVAIYT
ncbi:ribonuclease H-like domain-containing protein [Tanacetum coccineum]